MGCDIHAYIEYSDPKRTSEYWQNFGGEYNLHRDYGMFALMAGVRSCNDPDYILFKPKGLPNKLSYSVSIANYLLVGDEFAGSDGWVSVKKAELWVNQRRSKFEDESKNRVSNPDYHSHSWLSLEEYELVFARRIKLLKQQQEKFNKGHDEFVNYVKTIVTPEVFNSNQSFLSAMTLKIDVEYIILKHIMEKFKELGFNVRLVFWFDN